MIQDRTYPAKLLLFGEYTVLMGASALAIPLPRFSAQWSQAAAGSPAAALQQDLGEFRQWLEHSLPEAFEEEAFEAALEAGCYLESNIPHGYGLGSSGALCAAVLDRFGQPGLKASLEAELPLLRSFLAHMEGFFHGSSSGLDPLVSYLQRCVRLQGQQIQGLNALPPRGSRRLFLLDSGQKRHTGDLVGQFRQKLEDQGYANAIEKGYVPVQEALIDAFIAGQEDAFAERFAVLSVLQRDLFAAMIPPAILPLWQQGISSGKYFLKLCGAGGGGFFLGLSPDGQPPAYLQAQGYRCILLEY